MDKRTPEQYRSLAAEFGHDMSGFSRQQPAPSRLVGCWCVHCDAHILALEGRVVDVASIYDACAFQPWPDPTADNLSLTT